MFAINVTLDNVDLGFAEQRIRVYLHTFARQATRITRDLDFDSTTDREGSA
jgi:hypothetical protein